MASLSELLNPAPNSQAMMSSQQQTTVPDNDAETTSTTAFAPELFQIDSTNELTNLENDENDDDQFIIPSAADDRGFSVDESMLDVNEDEETISSQAKSRTSADKPTKRSADKKDPRHSSKNEGQHTDRRYLCYLCSKLFTRRRSVRDHLAKIHGTKTWEPSRSLEIVVEPESGEPVEPLEIQIARGGAAPAPTPRTSKSASKDKDTIEEEPEPDAEPEPESSEPPPVKIEASISEKRAESVEPTVPAPIIGKKRPLPINKKGTAKIKSSTPNKRPRLIETESRTPIRSPSITSTQRAPNSKLRRATESPASSRSQSVEASPSPSSSAETPGSTNDDGEVFCVCRKGDNHTWMIACDGGCEEWYHGRCVNIREFDGDLIDKYVCPNCTEAGFHTTWKRMCRWKDCRKPARPSQNLPSKFCSVECGRLFFVDLIIRGDPHAKTTRNGQYIVEMEKEKKRRRRRHKGEKKKKLPGDVTPMIDGSRPHTPAYSDDEKSDYETDSSLDEEMLPNRGGALRAAEVKALLEQCKTIDDWRALGRKPATPPQESDAMDVDDIKTNLNDFERFKLVAIKEKKAERSERMEMLKAREELLELIKKRSLSITEEVKKSNPKQKDLCGFDPRLVWSEAEFRNWWKDEGGIQSLQSGKIGPPASAEDEMMINGHTASDEDDAGNNMPTKGGICIKNRCQRHGSNRWQKAQLAELRFEQDLVKKDLDKLERQEKEIRDRVAVRNWAN